MRAKPDIKPWVNIEKSGLSSVGAALTVRCWGSCLGVVSPLRGSINVYQCLTQGLRPGLCRGVALTGLILVSTSYLLKWVYVLIWGSMLRPFCCEMCPKCTKGEKWCYTFALVAGKQVGLYIIRHSLRYLRHSGSVIYTSKLPSPSVLMPCDYHIL